MILLIRGQKVMLDADLARLYGATTERLNEQVKRNRARFPADFLFQLTETDQAYGFPLPRPAPPYTFTEYSLTNSNIWNSVPYC